MTWVKVKTKPRPPAPFVWHVARFAERWELADDVRFCRRGPLLHVKDYVVAFDDESAACLRQLAALRRHKNGLELVGAFSLVRLAAGEQSRAYRGYLLTPDKRPATDAWIARTILDCAPRKATRLLRTIASETGLLERVKCPIFDVTQNEPPEEQRAKSPRKRAKS